MPAITCRQFTHLLGAVQVDGEVNKFAVLGDQLLQLGLLQVL